MAQLEMKVERRDYSEITRRRTSWGAIFGGSFIALGVMMTLGMLGIAIGATTIDPMSGDSPSAGTLSIGGGIWWLVAGMLAFLAGGAAAGRFAGLRRRAEGPLHGLVVWGVATVFGIILVSSLIGGLMSSALTVVGTTAELAGTTEQALDNVQGTIAPEIGEVETSPGEVAQQIQQQAPSVAEATANLIATAAWFGFGYLVLTAVGAALGGFLGAPRPRSNRHPPAAARREREEVARRSDGEPSSAATLDELARREEIERSRQAEAPRHRE